MKVGIIGSGIVGQVLAVAFKNEGYEVTVGTRNTSKPELANFKKENPSISIGNFQDAAKFGDLLVLATSGSGAVDAVKLAGHENFRDKVVIDTTNPIGPGRPENGVLKFFTNAETSLMEIVQNLIPEARFVKAFNSVGNTLMYKPRLTGGKPTMFICGNDDDAKNTVTDILIRFGWEIEDMGKATAARAIEPLCILWCIQASSAINGTMLSSY